MKHFYAIVLLLSSICLNAQYYKAKLLMASGEIKEGLAELPSNQLLNNRVAFKESEKENVQKIDDDDIDQILYTTSNGNQFLFERSNVIHLYKSFGKEIERERSQKHWILLFHQNSKLKVYSMAERYKIDKKGTMVSIAGTMYNWEIVYFLYKRKEEDKAYVINGKGFTNGMARKAMEIYFKDTPALVERIEGKEFKKEGFPVDVIADAYAKYFDEDKK